MIFIGQAAIKMHTLESYRLLPDYFVDGRRGYRDKIYQAVVSVRTDLAVEAQIGLTIKQQGVTQVDWLLLKRIAFICQDSKISSSCL